MLFNSLSAFPSDLEVGYVKSILTRMTRTETFSITIYFKEPLLFITFSRECVFICYLFPLEHETGSDKFFCFVTPKNCVCDNIN